MKRNRHFILFLFFILNLIITQTTFAWNHSIELGYGYSHDPNHTKYSNSGYYLSGDFFSLRRTCWTNWTINGALGQWRSTAPVNKNLTSAALSLALRLYPFNIGCYPSYILASAGPAYISKQKFGLNAQASHLTIQTNIGLGVEVNCFDVNLRMVHFSNANLAQPNYGYNILYVLSLGYLF